MAIIGLEGGTVSGGLDEVLGHLEEAREDVGRAAAYRLRGRRRKIANEAIQRADDAVRSAIEVLKGLGGRS